jgi:methylglutaconyl-CoA hydratase
MHYIKYEVKDKIAFITLARADKRNALNFEVVNELKEAFVKGEEDAQAKVIVLRAEGDVFCAGADLEYLKKLQKNSYQENLEDSTNLMELFRLIYNLKKVVVAQVNGHAIAGGSGLASVCDFVFSVQEANFGYTEVKIGFIPAIVMIFLIRKLGEAKARHLLLSGDLITAIEAKELGLVYKLVAKEELENEVLVFAKKLITGNSALAMATTKNMISEVQNLTLDEALSYASEMNAKARASDDCQRGIGAFLKKEKIQWD